jgi:hypothetical protein
MFIGSQPTITRSLGQKCQHAFPVRVGGAQIARGIAGGHDQKIYPMRHFRM